jgi:hypothetical protein
MQALAGLDWIIGIRACDVDASEAIHNIFASGALLVSDALLVRCWILGFVGAAIRAIIFQKNDGCVYVKSKSDKLA